MDKYIKTKDEQQQMAQPDATKRNLIKGIAASGLVLTVSSQSAWGGDAGCSISGNWSGNASRTANNPYDCRASNGKSPGFWKTHPGCWPAGINIGTIIAKYYMGKKLKEREIAVSGKPQIEKIFLDNHGKLRKQVKINRIKRKVTYEFRNDGTTLIGLLGIGDTLMTILQGTASFPKHVTAALLSALYSDTYGGYQYSYSYNEIVSAVESAVNGDYGKVDDLDEILQALQGSSGKDDDNSVRVVR